MVQEIHKNVTKWIHVTMRLPAEAPYLEIEYSVGPIPIDDDKGKEVSFILNSFSFKFIFPFLGNNPLCDRHCVTRYILYGFQW